MEIGILGDPHGNIPDLDKSYDAIITTGDFGGKLRTRQAVHGARTKPQRDQAMGKAMDEAETVVGYLNDLDSPVYTVQGNWDFRYDRWTMQCDNIHPTDDDVVETEEFDILGYPATDFNTGPEIRYEDYGVVDSYFFEEELDKAEWGEGDVDVDQLLDQLVIPRHKEDSFLNEFEHYQKRRDELAARVEAADPETPTILLSHNAPFNVSDKHGSWDLDRIEKGPKQGLNYGSLAVKRVAIDAADELDLIACGHIHEGYGIGDIAGTPVVNAGEAGIVDGDLTAAEYAFRSPVT